MSRAPGLSASRCLVAAAWLALAPLPCPAADEPLADEPRIVGVRVGLDGHYKLGHWMPVEVTIRGGKQTFPGRVSVSFPDDLGVSVRYSTPRQRPVSIEQRRETRTVLYAKSGRVFDVVDVRLDDANGNVMARAQVELGRLKQAAWNVSSEKFLFVAWGARFLDGDEESQKNHEVARVLDAGDLPAQWYGYDAVDALVVNANRPELFRKLLADSGRLAALEEWIELGGRLILCCGSEAHATLDPQSPLSRFAPGKLAEVDTLRTATRLEQFSGSNRQIPTRTGGQSIDLPVARLKDIDGVVVVKEGETPLVVRQARGFGEIVFVACDLDAKPLADWEGRRGVVRKLLAGPGAAESSLDETSARTSWNYGYQDLVGQLRGALDQFPGVRLVPFWVVGLAIVGYILLIGPGDYWFVKHVLKRMELTWITFPAIVVAVSLAAYVAAVATKGSQLLVNQVDVVDVDAASGLTRGQVWLDVFSPRTTSYQLSLAPRAAGDSPPRTLFSWLGVPGDGVRGMNQTAGAGLFGGGYQIVPEQSRISGVPIDVWSTRTFVGAWHARAEGDNRATLREFTEQTLQGDIVNPLDKPLRGCNLFYDRWAWRLGDLAAGQRLTLQAGQQTDLQTALRMFTVDETKHGGKMLHLQPYDLSARDIPTIVRAMMFHEAAGGKQYTNVFSRFEARFDLSHPLRLRRAVLVGAGPSDEADRPTDLFDGDRPLAGPGDQRWVFYRVVFPVAAQDP